MPSRPYYFPRHTLPLVPAFPPRLPACLPTSLPRCVRGAAHAVRHEAAIAATARHRSKTALPSLLGGAVRTLVLCARHAWPYPHARPLPRYGECLPRSYIHSTCPVGRSPCSRHHPAAHGPSAAAQPQPRARACAAAPRRVAVQPASPGSRWSQSRAKQRWRHCAASMVTALLGAPSRWRLSSAHEVRLSRRSRALANPRSRRGAQQGRGREHAYVLGKPRMPMAVPTPLPMRLHTELSAVLRELRDLRNETQERAIRTVHHALVQQSPLGQFPQPERGAARGRRGAARSARSRWRPRGRRRPTCCRQRCPASAAPRCSQARARWCAQQGRPRRRARARALTALAPLSPLGIAGRAPRQAVLVSLAGVRPKVQVVLGFAPRWWLARKYRQRRGRTRA